MDTPSDRPKESTMQELPRELSGEATATKTSGKLLAAILALVWGALALAGCGGFGHDKTLRIGNIGWDENVAVSNLTKVLLEDELEYGQLS